MNQSDIHWKQLQRKTLLDTPYMKVWQDDVELQNGSVIEDYSVVSLPNGVVVVATDENNNNLIGFDEYKYAVDEILFTLPAGGIDKDETPVEAAARELLEESGYVSDDLEQIAELYVYPSKVKHTNYIVRAKNAKKLSSVAHEETEAIGQVQLIPVSTLKELRLAGKFNTTYMLSALALSFPESFN